MTFYQLYTRLIHALTAVHWRGYAVHSPRMYRFVREVVIRTRRRKLPETIAIKYGLGNVTVVGTIPDLIAVANLEIGPKILLLKEPFRTPAERRQFMAWYGANHVVVAHLQGLLVLFLDPKLQKQYYRIRN